MPAFSSSKFPFSFSSVVELAVHFVVSFTDDLAFYVSGNFIIDISLQALLMWETFYTGGIFYFELFPRHSKPRLCSFTGVNR